MIGRTEIIVRRNASDVEVLVPARPGFCLTADQARALSQALEACAVSVVLDSRFPARRVAFPLDTP